MCCIADLRDKEVINIRDGGRLGYVCDVELDPCDGRVCAIIVPDNRGQRIFSRSTIVIKWSCIVRIGEDVILVDFAPSPPKPPRKCGRRGLLGLFEPHSNCK